LACNAATNRFRDICFLEGQHFGFWRSFGGTTSGEEKTRPGHIYHRAKIHANRKPFLYKKLTSNSISDKKHRPSICRIIIIITRSALGRAHLPPTTVFRRLKTTRRCFDGRPIPVRGIFFDVIKFPVTVHMLWEKAIRFRHADYGPDRAQNLISSSMSRHLSTCNISSKSMHAFLSYLAHRQTDRQTNKRGRKHISPTLSEV